MLDPLRSITGNPDFWRSNRVMLNSDADRSIQRSREYRERLKTGVVSKKHDRSKIKELGDKYHYGRSTINAIFWKYCKARGLDINKSYEDVTEFAVYLDDYFNRNNSKKRIESAKKYVRRPK